MVMMMMMLMIVLIQCKEYYLSTFTRYFPIIFLNILAFIWYCHYQDDQHHDCNHLQLDAGDHLKHHHLHALPHPLSLSPEASFATSLHTPHRSDFHLLTNLALPLPSLVKKIEEQLK